MEPSALKLMVKTEELRSRTTDSNTESISWVFVLTFLQQLHLWIKSTMRVPGHKNQEMWWNLKFKNNQLQVRLRANCAAMQMPLLQTLKKMQQLPISLCKMRILRKKFKILMPSWSRKINHRRKKKRNRGKMKRLLRSLNSYKFKTANNSINYAMIRSSFRKTMKIWLRNCF